MSAQINKRLRNAIVVTAMVFINALFLLKYLARYIQHAELFTVLYIALIASGYWLWSKDRLNISRIILIMLTVVFALVFIVGLQMLPATKLNVDRWSVIYSFWETAFQGKYPYDAHSHMGNFPGPLPVYFLFALPFYAIKEIGYMPLISSVCFIFYLLKKAKRDNTDHSFAILLLLTSPCIYWEIIARSTLFFISFIWLIYADWFLGKELVKKHHYFSGIVGGLLLSTRFIYGMVLAIWAIYLWRSGKNLGKIISWGLIVGLVFALTVIPLWFMFPDEFMLYNPFHTESSAFVPFAFNFLFLGIAVLCGWLSKDNKSTIFLSGIAMFLIVMVYFAYHILRDGWTNAFTNSYADISYFIMAIPFLLAVIEVGPLKAVNTDVNKIGA